MHLLFIFRLCAIITAFQSGYLQLLAVTGSYPWLLLESEHKGPYRPIKAGSEPFEAVGVCLSVSSLKPPVIGQQIPLGRLYSSLLSYSGKF